MMTDGGSEKDPSGPPENIPPSLSKLIGFSILVLSGIIGLSALGVWQIERRAWKLDLIHQVDERRQALATAAPEPRKWAYLSSEHDAYTHVYLHGIYLNDHETLIHAVTEAGAGYWVMTPMRTDEEFIVLVNRGFVPSEKRDHVTRSAGDITGTTTVVGLLRFTEPHGHLLRINNPEKGNWYSRDVAAIAKMDGLSNVAPYFIDADKTPNAGVYPIGGLTIVSFSNNHLIYAVIWFSLAFMLSAFAVISAREDCRWRLKSKRQNEE